MTGEIDFRMRADELWAAWREKQVIRTRGPVESVTHYLPYLLATVYYSAGIIGEVTKELKLRKQKDDLSRKKQLWIDEVIDRIMQFATLCDITQQGCRHDLTDMVEGLSNSLVDGELIANGDVVANKLFSVLQKHNPKVNETQRSLIDFIVRAELDRLFPQRK